MVVNFFFYMIGSEGAMEVGLLQIQMGADGAQRGVSQSVRYG